MAQSLSISATSATRDRVTFIDWTYVHLQRGILLVISTTFVTKCYLWRQCGRLTGITTVNFTAFQQFSEMEEKSELFGEPAQRGFLTSLAAFYRRWIVLEPTIFLFLVSGRMVYFTRANLFIDVSWSLQLELKFCRQVVCCGMKNMTEAQCGNLTTETKKQVMGNKNFN